MFRDSALQGQTFPLGAQLGRGCQLQSPNFRWSELLPPPHHRGFLKMASGLSGAKDLAGIKDLNVRGLHRPEIRKSLLWPALATFMSSPVRGCQVVWSPLFTCRTGLSVLSMGRMLMLAPGLGRCL